MAWSEEELNKRRAQREKLRRQRLEQQRKLILKLIGTFVVLVLCGFLIFAVTRDNIAPSHETTISGESNIPDTAPPTGNPTKPVSAKTVVHLAAVGDLNVTDKTVAAGNINGTYDYSRVFMDVTPLLTEADLTVMNFEGNLCGAPYGSAYTSAPQQMMEAMAHAGIDLVQMANSCAINNGLSGLRQTLNQIRAAGLEPLGAYGSQEEFKDSGGYTIREVQGIRIAFVAFTKGMDNMSLPAGGEDCINLLYEDYAVDYSKVNTAGITKILRAAESEKPDLTVAMLHWGSEYNDQISTTQKTIQELMFHEGVDVLIGTHPHYVQEMKLNTDDRTFIAYSLGDFFGNAEKSGSNYSVVLNLEITKDNLTGITTVSDYRYDPIFTMKGEEGLQVVRIKEAMTTFESNNIQRISQEDYDAMSYALDRIEARIHPEK